MFNYLEAAAREAKQTAMRSSVIYGSQMPHAHTPPHQTFIMNISILAFFFTLIFHRFSSNGARYENITGHTYTLLLWPDARRVGQGFTTLYLQ